MKLNNNSFLLLVGALLIAYGLFGSNLGSLVSVPTVSNNVVVAPLNPSLRSDCEKVTAVFRSGKGNRRVDGVNLSSLYSDISKLISLDNENETIKNTDEIRDANRLAGLLYDLDLKGKYPELSTVTTNVIKNYIGDDNVALDSELRKKAAEAFNGLSWAFYEGSK